MAFIRQIQKLRRAAINMLQRSGQMTKVFKLLTQGYRQVILVHKSHPCPEQDILTEGRSI